ncbi:SWI SNF, matrix associated, actin dependent regulator of chromatin, sub c, member 2, partial [Nowakowskiella sp. JEL0078]
MPLQGLTYSQYYQLPRVISAFESLRPLLRARIGQSGENVPTNSETNPSALELATFTALLLQFQVDHLGPMAVVTSKTNGILRIPGRYFRETIIQNDDDSSDSGEDESQNNVIHRHTKDKKGPSKNGILRSIPSPALACILATSWKFKRMRDWKKWDFASSARKAMLLELIQNIIARLKDEGFMESPKVYILPSVKPSSIRDQIVFNVKKLHGTIVPMSPEVTHIIGPAENVDYGDQEFYRTLEKKDGVVCLHYWYRPDSADVWLTNILESQFLDPEPPPNHTGPWRVTTKWITDSITWNELMNEEDYEIEEEEPMPPINTPTKSKTKSKSKPVVDTSTHYRDFVGSERVAKLKSVRDHEYEQTQSSKKLRTEEPEREKVKPIIKIKMPVRPESTPSTPPTPPVKISLAVTKKNHSEKESRESRKAREIIEREKRELEAKLAKAERDAEQARLAKELKETKEREAREAREKEAFERELREKEAKELEAKRKEQLKDAKAKEKVRKISKTNSIQASNQHQDPASFHRSVSNLLSPSPMGFRQQMFPQQFYPVPTPRPNFNSFPASYPPLNKTQSIPHPGMQMMRPVFNPSHMPWTQSPTLQQLPSTPWWREHPYPLFKIIDLDNKPPLRSKKIEFEPINESQGGVILSVGRNRSSVLKLQSETSKEQDWLSLNQKIEKEDPWIGIGVGFVVGGVKMNLKRKLDFVDFSKSNTINLHSDAPIFDAVSDETDVEMTVPNDENLFEFSEVAGLVGNDVSSSNRLKSSTHSIQKSPTYVQIDEEEEEDEDDIDARNIQQFITKTIKNGGVAIPISQNSSRSSAELFFQIHFPTWFDAGKISVEERLTFPEFLNPENRQYDSATEDYIDSTTIDLRYMRLRNAVVFHHLASQLSSFIISKDLPQSSIPFELKQHISSSTTTFNIEKCWNGLMWHRDPLKLKNVQFPKDLSSLKPRRSMPINSNMLQDEKSQLEAEIDEEIVIAEYALST